MWFRGENSEISESAEEGDESEMWIKTYVMR